MDAAAHSGSHIKVYTARSNGAGLVLSGLALACLGAVVVCFAAFGQGLRGDRELLLATGVGVGLCGSYFAWLGARPRRHWIAIGELGLRQPWALGKPRIGWHEIREIAISLAGGVWVGTGNGRARLRIARELDDYDLLVDEICDRMNENLGAPPRSVWRTRSGSEVVRLTKNSLDVATPDGELRVHLQEIRAAFIDVDARLRQTTGLLLRNGERVTLPYLGDRSTLELYRALRLRPR